MLVLTAISGEATGEILVEGDPGGCPSPLEVQRALDATLPGAERASATLKIVDEGSGFLLSAAGDARRFEDPSRQCEERARKAAIFIALYLAPEQGTESVATTSPPAPRGEVRANPPPPRLQVPTDTIRWPSAQLELGGLFAAAPGADASVTGGGAVRLFVGGRFFGGVVGMSGMAPVVLTLTGARARLVRVPVELGVRGRLFLRRSALSLDATLVLGPMLTEGLDVSTPDRQTRVEVGLAAVARYEYWATWRVAPMIQFAVEGAVRGYDFSLPGAGVVGHPPRVWLSAIAGLSVRLR